MFILGNAEVLEDKLSEHPHLQRLAKMTLDVAERGADLTDRLLAFSRKQTLEPKVLDVVKLVQGMDGLLRRTLPEDIEGYAGEAEHWPCRRTGRKWSLMADILRTC